MKCAIRLGLFLLIFGNVNLLGQDSRISKFKCRLPNDAKSLISIFAVASGEGDEDCVRKILKTGMTPNVRLEGNMYATPIFMAVAKNRFNIIRLLFANGLNRKSDETMTAFFYAALNEPHLLEIFLKEGVPVDLIDPDGITALFKVAIAGDLDTMKLLIKHGADPNQKSDGSTILGSVGDDIMKTQLLIDSGANLNEKNGKHLTPVFVAVKKMQMKKLETLLKNGADPNMPDAKGIRPLQFSRSLPPSDNQRAVTAMLEKYGAK